MKLMQGDCLDLLATLEPGSIDMVLADPPYGTTQCKWDSIIPLGPLWWLLKRVVKPNGAIVMMAGQPFTSALIMSNLPMFKYCWVWDKNQITGFLNAKKQPLRCYEDLTVFYKKQCTYNPQMVPGVPYKQTRDLRTKSYGAQPAETTTDNVTGDRYPKNILSMPHSRIKNGHPTQKPTALMEYMVKTYTDPGQMVLDFSMGSGTTGVAAVRTGREFIGIELDEGYFSVARDRINLEIIAGGAIWS